MSAPVPSPCPALADLHAAADLHALPADLSAHLEACPSCRHVYDEILADNALAMEIAGLADRPTVIAAPAADAHVPELPDGTRIANFTITGVLGVGGMGVVYRATQDSPARPVALKLIKTDYTTPSLLRRFEHEAAALALLKHPGIAQVYQAGAVSLAGATRPFIAMELVEGQRLDEYVKTRAPGRTQVLRLVAAIADAVDHAHRRGVIHRDLKPANILVESPGAAAAASAGPAPRILDFGVAKLAQTTPSMDATQPGGFVGTLAYAAPEQVAGDPAAIDARADVFALGLILYELLVGRRAYALDGPLHTAIQTIAHARITPPATHGVRLDAELSTILSTALAAEPARRYQSAAALAEDLRRFIAKRPLRARPDSTLYTIRMAVARHPYRAAGAAGLAAVLAVVSAVSISLHLRAAASDRAKGRVLDTVLESWKRANQDSDETERVTSITELFDQASVAFDQMLADQPEERDALQFRLAQVRISHRQLDEAADALVNIVANRRPGAESPAGRLPLAEALHELGRARYFQGRFSDARDHLKEAVEIRGAARSASHTETVESRYWLGVSLLGWRQLAAAETELRAVAELESAVRPDSPQVAEYLNTLAACIRHKGDFAGAIEIARRSLVQIERVKGDDHKHVAVVLGNIVANLISLERYDEAEPLITRALAIREKWYGPEDPRVADTLVQLAALKMRRGDFGQSAEQRALLEEGAVLANRTLALRQRVHAGDHESIAEILSILGQIRMRQERYTDALPALTAAMDMRARLPRRNDGDLGRSESLLGDCLRRAGRPADAEPLLRSGLQKIRAGYGPAHRHTADAEKRLADLK